MQATNNFGTVKVLMLKGEPGEKGESGRFEQLTDEQKAEIKGDVATFYRKEEGTYITKSGLTTVVPIPLDYHEYDILFVDIDGLDVAENKDYTISGGNLYLTAPIERTGAVVHFTLLRTVQVSSDDYAKIIADVWGGLTPEQKEELKNDAAAFYRKQEGYFTTTDEVTDAIEIPFTVGNYDMLLVDVEGLTLTEGKDYTVRSNKVFLTDAITHTGTTVHFVVMSAISIPVDDYSKLIEDMKDVAVEDIIKDAASKAVEQLSGTLATDYTVALNTEHFEYVTQWEIDEVDVPIINDDSNAVVVRVDGVYLTEVDDYILDGTLVKFVDVIEKVGALVSVDVTTARIARVGE